MNEERPSSAEAAERKRTRNEKGVALILALGVLALVVVMALSFAFQARTEREASAVSSDVTKARLLCESGLERAMAYLHHAYDGEINTSGNFDPHDIYPATKGGSGSGDGDEKTIFAEGVGGDWEDRYWAVSTQSSNTDNAGLNTALATTYTDNSGNSYEFVKSASPVAGSPDASWIHVENATGIVGRIGYLMVDESGKVATSTAVINSDESSGSTIKRGRSSTEICLADIGISDSEANEFRYESYSPGQMPDGKRWFSLQHIVRRIEPDTWFDPILKALSPQSYDMNAWWQDDGNDQWDSGEDKHRFDFYSANFDGMNETYADNANSNFLGASTDIAYATAANNTDRIPWVGKLEASSDVSGNGGSPDITDDQLVQQQVAANIIDYCDSENPAEPTTNYGGSIGTPPDYVGLEEAPYINEAIFTFDRLDSDGNGVYKLDLSEAKVELVNIYGSGSTYPNNVRISIQFSYDTDGDATTTEGTAGPFTGSCSPPGAGSFAICTTSPSFTTAEVNSFRIVDVKVSLRDDSTGHLLDYAQIGGNSASADLSSTGLIYTHAECRDPRANLHPLGWEWIGAFNTTSGNGDSPSSVDPVNDDNTDVQNPSSPSPATSDHDTETATNPVNISTAYIRNGPPKSLWELGAIHRGEPWKTLNIDKYNDGSNDEIYGNGDAAILGQVKLEPQTQTRGKFNANSPQKPAWEAVLAGITVGGEYDAPGGGDPISNFNIIDTDGGGPIFDKNGTNSGTPFSNRGGIAQAGSLADGTAGSSIDQNTDRTQEEIIGKIANLLTVRQNYFTVIVVGQAIKDVGGISTASYGTFDPDHDQILAEQKIKAVVYRDAFSNELKVERYEFLED